ncbi:hypothetical protein [Actinoplanes sp. L3-i22]|uniref:hypothetical protein n=1 Tax=Actinoplanes sp. L3-i22 TaxID=2836373 RepID=UPI001C771C81|nr:hypothetical protein [Actinoplanes sp. L3-i22]BCY09016.1 hypothetical protein L3i22_041040 [Actinoplanes sp. L3-i22]
MIVDPAGGDARTQSMDLLGVGGRLLVVGNASGDWTHQIPGNQPWSSSTTIAGFNAGVYLPAHPQPVRPARQAALRAAAGWGYRT